MFHKHILILNLYGSDQDSRSQLDQMQNYVNVILVYFINFTFSGLICPKICVFLIFFQCDIH